MSKETPQSKEISRADYIVSVLAIIRQLEQEAGEYRSAIEEMVTQESLGITHRFIETVENGRTTIQIQTVQKKRMGF